MYKKLLLASTSVSRAEVLKEAQIPFQVIDQSADERSCSWDISVHSLVQRIARLKMDHAIVPSSISADSVCMVTADTLVSDGNGAIYGKPEGRDDAEKMIRLLRDREILVVTGMCIERRVQNSGIWRVDTVREVVSVNKAIFSIADDWISWYMDHAPSIYVAGTVTFDNVGLRFARYMEGSLASICGLPIYELQQILTELGFFAARDE